MFFTCFFFFFLAIAASNGFVSFSIFLYLCVAKQNFNQHDIYLLQSTNVKNDYIWYTKSIDYVFEANSPEEEKLLSDLFFAAKDELEKSVGHLISWTLISKDLAKNIDRYLIIYLEKYNCGHVTPSKNTATMLPLSNAEICDTNTNLRNILMALGLFFFAFAIKKDF